MRYTAEQIRELLKQLDRRKASELESETLAIAPVRQHQQPPSTRTAGSRCICGVPNAQEVGRCR